MKAKDGIFMAKIIENKVGRRTIRLSVDDVISTVREYQRIVRNPKTYEGIRILLKDSSIYLPEDI